MSKQVFVQPLDEAFNTAQDKLGDIRQEGNSWYKYVYYIGGTGTLDGVSGDFVFYTDDTGYAANEVNQDITDLAAKALPAGTLQCAIDISTFTAGAYVWIKIKGPETMSLNLASSVDGTPVVPADNDPLVPDLAVDGGLRRDNDVRDAAVELAIVCAYVVDDSANEVILDCPW